MSGLVLVWIGLFVLGVLAALAIALYFSTKLVGRLQYRIDMMEHNATRWCSVCGVVYERHPGKVDSSPPYTPPHPGGRWMS
jgi:hypothetical protein